MDGAIFYSGKYGSTLQYADWISEATGLPVFSIDDRRADPADYDYLVLGSSVIYFRLSIRKWVKRHAPTIAGRPTLLFTVSGAPTGAKLDRWVAKSLPDHLLTHVNHVALQGRQRPDELTRFDRAMLVIGSMFNRDRQARRDERQGFDHMDKSSIAPIVNRIRQLQGDAVRLR